MRCLSFPDPATIMSLLWTYISALRIITCKGSAHECLGSDFSSYHPLTGLHCRTLPAGIEYELKDAQEPHLFIICKQHRKSPTTVSGFRYYYILDGNVYQAPSLHVALASRLVSQSVSECCRECHFYMSQHTKDMRVSLLSNFQDTGWFAEQEPLQCAHSLQADADRPGSSAARCAGLNSPSACRSIHCSHVHTFPVSIYWVPLSWRISCCAACKSQGLQECSFRYTSISAACRVSTGEGDSRGPSHDQP